jgi:hypothetical protein
VRRTLFALLCAAVAAGVPASAHHSFAAHYFEEQTISIEGELVQFDYRSPHAWVHVMAKDDEGGILRFAAEWAGPTRLSQRGVMADTLKPGDWVIVSGSPGRNPSERRIHLKSIKRPADGWSWSR